MNDEMLCIEQRGKERHYKFKCPACDEEGDLGLFEDETGAFGCPAECGATFVEYKSLKGWAIRCVVMPIFEDSSM